MEIDMIEYSFKELVALGKVLAPASRRSRVPKDIQVLFGQILLSLPKETLELLTIETRRAIEADNAAVRDGLRSKYSDFSTFE
jgi:hypothetical protein